MFCEPSLESPASFSNVGTPAATVLVDSFTIDHTEFVIEKVVRSVVEVLISVGCFSVDGDFQGAIWLSHCVSSRKASSVNLPVELSIEHKVRAVQAEVQEGADLGQTHVCSLL